MCTFFSLLLFALPSLFSAAKLKDGCWEDKWIANPNETCVAHSQWLQWAETECGEGIRDFTQKECTHVFEFVCCGPNEQVEHKSYPELTVDLNRHLTSIFRELWLQEKKIKAFREDISRAALDVAKQMNVNISQTIRFSNDDLLSFLRSQLILMADPWGNIHVALMAKYHFERMRWNSFSPVPDTHSITSRHMVWHTMQVSLELQRLKVIKQTIEAVYSVIFQRHSVNTTAVKKGNLAFDIESALQIYEKNDFFGFPELRRRAEIFWREECVKNVWGIPDATLMEFLKGPNPDQAVASYYMEHVEDILHTDGERSGIGGSLLVIFLLATAFIVGLAMGTVLNNVRNHHNPFEFIRLDWRRNEDGHAYGNATFGEERDAPNSTSEISF
ncbi:hypothetical protein QR680_012317 [Steinernema hermaphroditum]|uniref:Folate receptor-like domain-containing protein n=1 Tax=Steinernema hermaphroditum TaxID=289476 RepID=A0AA39M0K3_9BILA|nr:hypothetical protein QR680_012317 [Steinernema hermaphroditum]